MRTRLVTAVAFVASLPLGSLAAQGVHGLPGGHRGPAVPAPLPQPVDPVARSLAYHRLPISVESYPMLSFIQAPLTIGGEGHGGWTSFGAGTHIDYRLSGYVSATLDVTSTLPGSGTMTQTGELGARFHPAPVDQQLFPFADVRVGMLAASIGNVSGTALPNTGISTFNGGVVSYGTGYGASAGVGAEYRLSRTFSLVSTASVMRTRMTSNNFAESGFPAGTFGLTAYRFSASLRYNPVRMITE